MGLSALVNNVNDTSEFEFIDPLSVAPSIQQLYPTANLSLINAEDSVTWFYQTNASGFYLQGGNISSQSFPLLSPDLHFTPQQLLIPAGLGYNDSLHNRSRLIVHSSSGGTIVRAHQHTFKEIEADSWGSLITPGGTFPNTLRVRTLTYYMDTVFVDVGGVFTPIQNSGPRDTSIVYSWYQSGIRFSVLQLAENPAIAGAPVSGGGGISYYDPRLLAAKPQLFADPLIVAPYPNPASSIVHFPVSVNSAELLLITDVLGRIVHIQTVKGEQQLTWIPAQCPVGNYNYHLLNNVGKLLQRGTFCLKK